MNSLEDMIAVGDAAKLAALMPYLEAVVASQEARIETQVERLLADGVLEPQVAVQLWGEKIAFRRILRTLSQKVAFGRTVGEDIAPEMVIARP